MTEFIILSKDELMTLCANMPVICYLRRKGKYVLCSEEYYAEQKESRSEIPNKSENPNTCGDAISRQAIEEIKEIMTDISGNSVYVARMSDIRTLPSVTPQQRTGQWIDSHIPESTLCECSECGFTCGAYSFNYCPDCGAKMEEE